MSRLTRALGVATFGAALAAIPLLLETQIARSARPLDDAWKRPRISPRGQTNLGISFRPVQAEAFGLDAQATLASLLGHPFEAVRLAAYWSRLEARAGALDTGELDWQVDAAERAGKKVILSVGAVKNFGYPEFFVPEHHLEQPLPEGSLISPSTHPALLSAAQGFIHEIVTRYRNRKAVFAWQLEHEAVDPLGIEHSWRLSADFVRSELDSLKAADPSRPVLMNGFLPTSSIVRISQWWRTRDQGDSLEVAARIADIVGIDYYPRHALFGVGRRAVYMDGARLPWQRAALGQAVKAVTRHGKRLMVTEGQAEPWEAVTLPPNPESQAMFSCGPADLIGNYNAAMDWAPLEAYLFWGAEYWILRSRSGDESYMQAFSRILDESG